MSKKAKPKAKRNQALHSNPATHGRVEPCPPAEVWLDVDGEHRRLYAVRMNAAGKLLFFMDRNEVLEFKHRADLPPYPEDMAGEEVILRLLAEDVMSISAMKGKGAYLILTHSGGSWAGYMLRRKYQDAERILIPADSEERDATAHKRPSGHAPGSFWLTDADKAATDAATTPEEKARITHGAELRGWMTPHEHEAWASAKTDSERQDIERRAAAAMQAEIESDKAKPLPGRPCPNCGKPLTRGPYCDAWCGGREGCHSVFGAKTIPSAKRGRKEDNLLASIEAWLAEPRTRAEIEAMLDPGALGNLYQAFGYAPLAWKDGVAILHAELKKRDMEKEGKSVKRIGAEVRYTGKDAPKPRRIAKGRRGQRGRRKLYSMTDLRKIEAAIAANGGSLIDTAKHQAPSDWQRRHKEIKLMHDAARKQGLTPKSCQ